MKKFSIFITVLLIILIVSLIFVLQNSATIVSLKFFGWTFPTVSVGLLTVIMFFAGFVVMWLIALMFYIGSAARYRRELKSKDKVIKQLQKEKDTLEKELKNKEKEIDALREQLNKVQTGATESAGQSQSNEQVDLENKNNNVEAKTSVSNVSDKVKAEKNEKTKRRGLFGRR